MAEDANVALHAMEVDEEGLTIIMSSVIFVMELEQNHVIIVMAMVLKNVKLVQDKGVLLPIV